VKIVLYRIDPFDGGAIWKFAIGAAQPAVVRTLLVGVEMNYLSDRVYPGIGSPCGMNPYRLIRNVRQRSFYDGLYAGRMRLYLPAVKLASIVFDYGCVSHLEYLVWR
jgi:hypothetical protein